MLNCDVEIVLFGTDSKPSQIELEGYLYDWERKGEGYELSFLATPEFIGNLLESLEKNYSKVLFRAACVHYGTMSAEAYTNDIEGEVFPEKYFYEGVAICFKDTDLEAMKFLNESLDMLAEFEGHPIDKSEYLDMEDMSRAIKVPVEHIGSFKDIHWAEE